MPGVGCGFKIEKTHEGHMCPKSHVLGFGQEVNSVIKCASFAMEHCHSKEFSYYENGNEDSCRCCKRTDKTGFYNDEARDIWTVEEDCHSDLMNLEYDQQDVLESLYQYQQP